MKVPGLCGASSSHNGKSVWRFEAYVVQARVIRVKLGWRRLVHCGKIVVVKRCLDLDDP